MAHPQLYKTQGVPIPSVEARDGVAKPKLNLTCTEPFTYRAVEARDGVGRFSRIQIRLPAAHAHASTGHVTSQTQTQA